MAAYDRRLFERAGDVILLIRDGGRSEPDLATTYSDGRKRGDETRIQVFSSWPSGTLCPGLDLQTAVDVYAAICNIDVYTTLTTERGWPPARIEEWWGRPCPANSSPNVTTLTDRSLITFNRSF